jgi:class 3 adenylate cyclase
LISVQATLDARARVGETSAGIGVMPMLLVAPGGYDTGGLAPFDLIRAVNGQLVSSGAEFQREVRRYPPGTPLRYLVSRRGTLLEASVPSRVVEYGEFCRFLYEGLLPSLIYLALAAVVLALRPGERATRVFLAFCLTWFCTSGLYVDAATTYRFSALFLTSWAFSPALYIHIALRFPESRAVIRRHPRLMWVPYVASGLIAIAMLLPHPRMPVAWTYSVPAVGAVYWAAGLLALILGLVEAGRRAASPLNRQRARVLAAGFAVGQLLPVLGTTVEAVSGWRVPYLNAIWRLNFLFPAAVAYAMLRYDLFDVRAVMRMGTVYAAVTGLVVAVYAGSIALVNVAFTSLGLGESQIVPAIVVALAVVLFLNPVYRRTQGVVDRLFFREQRDVRLTIERVADTMTTLLDLKRIAGLISTTVDELLHPRHHALLLRDEARGEYRTVSAGDGPAVSADGELARLLARRPAPLTRERLAEDPELEDVRRPALAAMADLGAELIVPVVFRDRVTGLLVLGAKRAGTAYTTEDLRLTRFLVNQSAVVLENAKAYTALEAAHVELQSALRRVQILESIRAGLAKFVPRTVQDLIEEAPEAPLLEKREVDVTVLFVDIAGYTRLSERFDLARVNELVERYFGAFLDEIMRHGGDVNETAGDGLMVIFRGPDAHAHARSAVLAGQGVLRRAHLINGELAGKSEPIRLHVGVNSGTAAVGATKIEGTAGTRWTYTASGPVTNLAARLAALGEGDAVILGGETARRLDAEFSCEDWGERRLRNVEEPVRVFRVPVFLDAAAMPAGVA